MGKTRKTSPGQQFPGLRLGRIFGVEIGIDWSLAIIFFLILVMLGGGLFPSWHPDWSWPLTWAVALAAAVLFFCSVLAHEMSHAIVANRNDIPVRRITLFLFGGMAHMEKEPPSARAEFKMAVVGPLTSIVIGIAATAAGLALAANGGLASDDPEAFIRGLGPVETALMWLGPINIILGVFNLIPGFPLDGGRVLRAGIWAATGDLRKATRWSSNVGRGFAWFLMGYGVFVILAYGVLGGVWWILIGWFLNNAARASYYQLLMREAFEDVPVRELMRLRPATVSAELTIAALVEDYIMATDQRAFPIVRDDELVGLVTLDDVRRVPRGQWNVVPVSQIMTPVENLITVGPEDEAVEAFHELASRGVNQVPVVDRGHLHGMVRREDVMKWLSVRGHDMPV